MIPMLREIVGPTGWLKGMAVAERAKACRRAAAWAAERGGPDGRRCFDWYLLSRSLWDCASALLGVAEEPLQIRRIAWEEEPGKRPGILDDLVIDGVAWVHIEAMDYGHLWIGIYDAKGRSIHVNVGNRGTLRARVEVNP